MTLLARMNSVLLASSWCAILLILLGSYPPSLTLRFGRHWAVYFEMSAIISAIGIGAILLAQLTKAKQRYVRAMVSFLLSTIIVSAYGIIYFNLPSMRNGPLAEMNAAFLGGYMALKFAFVVAPLCGAVFGAMSWLEYNTRPGVW